MIIGGIQKHSLIDYPGLVSAVVFLSGCNFRCPYCHNPELVRPDASSQPHQEKNVLEFLADRRGLLDGVVVSGGEPTLQQDLGSFCSAIREMGFRIKLDTNGSRPDVIRTLLTRGLIDYVAMDVKTDPVCYPRFIRGAYDAESIVESIRTIMEAAPDYEFRTTCVRPIVDASTLRGIAKAVRGARLHVLQPFVPGEVLLPEFFTLEGGDYSARELSHMKEVIDPWVESCVVRGQEFPEPWHNPTIRCENADFVSTFPR